ncbi:MAG: hypothetical protein ACJ8FO_06290 [Sphingomicrobium sp.]|jgi:hypothetical protein
MLLVATLLVAAAASAEPIGDMPIINPKAGQPASCPATSRYEASGRGKTPKAQKLTELPDADVYRAVYRHIGKCEAPIIVRFGVVGR